MIEFFGFLQYACEIAAIHLVGSLGHEGKLVCISLIESHDELSSL